MYCFFNIQGYFLIFFKNPTFFKTIILDEDFINIYFDFGSKYLKLSSSMSLRFQNSENRFKNFYITILDHMYNTNTTKIGIFIFNRKQI